MTFQTKKLAQVGDQVQYTVNDRGGFVISHGKLEAVAEKKFAIRDDDKFKGSLVIIERSQAMEFQRNGD